MKPFRKLAGRHACGAAGSIIVTFLLVAHSFEIAVQIPMADAWLDVHGLFPNRTRIRSVSGSLL